MMFDKSYKMYTGMYYIAKEMRRTGQRGGSIMPVDADDLVNNHLAEFFHGRNDEKCYMSKFGYIWHESSGFFTVAKNMWLLLCNILQDRRVA